MCTTKLNDTFIYVGNKNPELKDLNDYVAITYASKWKLLGRILNIKEELLRNIEKDHPKDCEECYSRMLSDWLELTPDATWGTLLKAVDNCKVQSTPDYVEGMCLAVVYML